MSDHSPQPHVGDSAGAYVLGALGEVEAHEVESHAAACPQCRQEIAELRRVVAVLPLASPSVEPSPALKRRILSATRSEDRVDAVLRRSLEHSREREVKHDVWHRSFPSWAGVAGWVGVAAACIVGGIFIGIADEHYRMTALQAQGGAPPASIGRIIAAKTAEDNIFRPSVEGLDPRVAFVGESKVWDLSLNHKGMPCKVIQPPNKAHAMIVADMPKAEHDMVYRVWLVRKGEMLRGGTIAPGKMMQTTLPMDVHSGDVIAFSIESPNGSAASGPFVYETTL